MGIFKIDVNNFQWIDEPEYFVRECTTGGKLPLDEIPNINFYSIL